MGGAELAFASAPQMGATAFPHSSLMGFVLTRGSPLPKALASPETLPPSVLLGHWGTLRICTSSKSLGAAEAGGLGPIPDPPLGKAAQLRHQLGFIHSGSQMVA